MANAVLMETVNHSYTYCMECESVLLRYWYSEWVPAHLTLDEGKQVIAEAHQVVLKRHKCKES